MSPELSRTRTLPAPSISMSPELSPTSARPAMRSMLEIAGAVLQRERLQILERGIAARVGGFHRNARRQRDADVDVGVFVVAQGPALVVLRKRGFDVDDVAFAPHADLRGIQQLLLGGAGHAARFDAHRIAAADHLHVAGARADDDLFDALGFDAARRDPPGTCSHHPRRSAVAGTRASNNNDRT